MNIKSTDMYLLINNDKLNCGKTNKLETLNNKPQNISDGTSPTKQENFDRIELNQESINKTETLNNNEIKTEVPRSWTITLETLKSRINHIDKIVTEANNKNMSYGERMYFLEKKGQEWVEDIRKNDSEMFAEWLKINKSYIQSGQPEIASLPSDFTMEDYNFYVGKYSESNSKTSDLNMYI